MNLLISLLLSTVLISSSDGDKLPRYWLPEVVVTAKRIREPLSEVAVDMRVITKEEISQKGFRTVTDILTQEGFLDVRTTGIEGGLTTTGLRGFPADHVLVLINGIVLNSPANGCFDFSEIPITTVEKIEIVKNPSSSLYGANASAGVINIITLDEIEEGTDIEANGNITHRGAIHLTGDAGYKSGDYAASGNITKRNSSGDRSNSDFESISGNGNVSFKKIIRARFSTGKREVGVPGPVPSEDYIPSTGDSTAYSLKDNQKTEYYTGSAHMQKNIADFLFTANLGFRNEDMEYLQFYEASDDVWNYNTRQFNATFQLSYKDISAGMDYTRDKFKATDSLFTSNDQTLISTQYWEPARKTKGFWGSIKHKFLSGKVISSASIRWDKTSDYEDVLSYSGGLLYLLKNNIKIGASVGSGFRPPTFNELYWPGMGNRELKPEESFQTNLYTDLNIKNRFFVRFSGFYRKVENSISWVNYKPQNVDELISKGIEISPTLNPTDYLSLSFSATLMNVEERRLNEDSLSDWNIEGNIVSKRRAPYIPEKKFTGSVEWNIEKCTYITFTSIYTGEKINYYMDYMTSEYKIKTIENVTIHNLNILQKLGERFSLSFRIDNLFDKKYKTNFGYSLTDADYPAPDRTFSLGLNIKG
jgi:vitamin B12 transporter